MSNVIDTRSVVVCDQLRREDNGKLLVIGAYLGDILVQTFPAPLPLSFYFLGIGARSGASEIEYKIQHTLSNGASPAAIAKVQVSDVEVGRAAGVLVAGASFNFDQETELVISVSESGEWRELERKRVLCGPVVTFPAGSPRPS